MRHPKLMAGLFALMLWVLVASNLHTDINAVNNVRVKLKVCNKTVTKKSISIKNGKSKTLKVYLDNEKIRKSMVTFKSTKKFVASIDKRGVIKAKKAGTAKIKVFIKKKGKTYQSWVKVKVMKQQKEMAMAETTDINMKVKDKTFAAKIYNHDAGRQILAKMPFTLDMEELNGNEKYYYSMIPLRLYQKIREGFMRVILSCMVQTVSLFFIRVLPPPIIIRILDTL